MKSKWRDEIWKYIYKAGEKDMAFRACVIIKRQGIEPDDKIFFELIKLLADQRTNMVQVIEECRLHHSPPLLTSDSPLQ